MSKNGLVGLLKATYPNWHNYAAKPDDYTVLAEEKPLLISPDDTKGMTLENGVWADRKEFAWGPIAFTVFWDTAAPTRSPDPPTLPVRESEVPLVGYRVWDVDADDDGFFLESPHVDTKWEGPVLRAEGKPCAYDPHEVVWKTREDHCHGIYAHDTPEWSEDFEGGVAIGKVELTGRVVVHECGFRAEMARIVRLVLHPSLLNSEGIIESLSKRYACDVSFDPTTLEV